MKEAKIREHIEELLASQMLATLATQKNGQPYVNLIAFAVADQLATLIFATPRATRKYTNLQEESRVSLLVDCRGNQQGDFHQASAVTIIGEATEADSVAVATYLPIFVANHPYLEDFVNAPTTSLFVVAVKHYVLVSHFQRVMELHLTDETDLFT